MMIDWLIVIIIIIVVIITSAEKGTRGLMKMLREIYVLYADCTLKDPFYELEMPIRGDLFNQAIDDLFFDKMDNANSGSTSNNNNAPIIKLRWDKTNNNNDKWWLQVLIGPGILSFESKIYFIRRMAYDVKIIIK